MDYAAAIKQQADDLQDELKELALWQEEVVRQQETNPKKRVDPFAVGTVPPIRGTVPSLKDAVMKSANVVEKEDPVKLQKDKGNNLFQNGRLEEAIDAYGVGIDIDPNGQTAHVLFCNRALCYLKLNRWADAERDASSCVRLNRTYPKGYFRRAMARKHLGNLKGARVDLEAVLALLPNDTSATNEIKLITKMLQTERESGVPVVRKKIAIMEVDEEEQDVGDNTCSNTVSSSQTNKREEPCTEGIKSGEVRKEIAELERARVACLDARDAKSREAEAKVQLGRRASSRVEVLDEDIKGYEKEKEETFSPPLSKNVARQSEAAQDQATKEQPAYSTGVVRTQTVRNTKQEAVTSVRALKTAPKWSKETLKMPKSFTEFERVFSDLGDDEDLRCFYISIIPPGSMRELFGSNMTPEILFGMLKAARRLPGTAVAVFLRGLCTVRRVEDISLFFDGAERKVAKEVIDIVVSCGASQQDINLFAQRLGVL
uniref:RNA polymerase II-associated protein 3 n=1 Tax=Trypanosoma congolense (strain IL3000) TaxID=1068625 RepID=G0UJJ5_TRYCI|nr:putative TPR-repeat protein [Trypanosoma congolense IL3000]